MTVSSATIPKDIYTGTDALSAYAYTFKIYADTDLKVSEVVIATGVQTDLVLTTDYTVSGVGDVGGGTVTLTAGNLPSTKKLILKLNLPLTQLIDYVALEKFPADTNEEGLDRLVLIAQMLQEQLDRAILQAETETATITFPVGVAGRYIAWDDDDPTLLVNKTAPVSVDGPAIVTGDASKILGVKTDESGLEHRELFKKGSDIASATSITLSDENYYDITGTTNIQTIGIKPAGFMLLLHFDGALTLVDDTGNLELNGANVSISAEDNVILLSDGTNWHLLSKYAAAGSLNVRVGSFTRDTSTATGTQTISGVGFTPKAVLFLGAEADSDEMSFGIGDDSLSRAANLATRDGIVADTFNIQSGAGQNAILFVESSGNSYGGVIDSMNSDGFVISWTKTGTPTGTVTCGFLAIG